MRRFVEGVDRSQTTLFPESLDDWVSENNPARVIDAFVDALDLRDLGFDGVARFWRKHFVSEFQLLEWRFQWRRNRCSRAGILIDL